MLMWIDEEYNKIEPKTITESDIIGLEINGKKYLPGGDGQLCVHRNTLKGFFADELPPKLVIVPVEQISEEFINQGTFPVDIAYNGKMMVCLAEFTIYPDEFSGEFYEEDLCVFNQVHKKIISKKYVIEEIIEEDECKSIFFAFNVLATMDIGDVLNIMEDTVNNIFGSITQYNNLKNINEEAFTKYYVIPALQRRGMINVRYTHGIEEYGRDIVYQFYDNFGQLRYGAVQVKAGNISGNANGKLKEILEQIEDCFEMPYKDLLKKQEVNIEQVVIICSGSYTNNAQEKIINKVVDGRNIIFLDGQDIGNILCE